MLKHCVFFALLLGVTIGIRAEQSYFDHEGVFVYSHPVGGPYFDGWFVTGDRVGSADLRLWRDGKSGDLNAPIRLDCVRGEVRVTGHGVKWTNTPISEDMVEKELPEQLKGAVLRLLCQDDVRRQPQIKVSS